MTTSHLSWKYRRRRNPQQQREFTEAQRRRVFARWDNHHVGSDPRAPDRLKTRLTIQRPAEPMQIVEEWIIDAGCGRSTRRFTINGQPSRFRSFSAIYRAIELQSQETP